jgi:hypothetical protein
MHSFLGPSDPKLTHSIPRRPLFDNSNCLVQTGESLLRGGGCAHRCIRAIGLVAWCAGILASIGLTVWLGFADVGNAVASVGWGMPFVALTRVATISVAGVGWWLLLPASGRFKLWSALLLRFIREGVNTLLPLTQVGGDVVGARLSTFWAVPSSLATAGIIIDVLMQAVTQFLFAALGLVMLVALAGDTTVTWIAATGLALAIPMLAGFYLAQRRSGHRILYFALSRLKNDSKAFRRRPRCNLSEAIYALCASHQRSSVPLASEDSQIGVRMRVCLYGQDRTYPGSS